MTCAEAGTSDEDDHPMPDDAPSTDQEPEREPEREPDQEPERGPEAPRAPEMPAPYPPPRAEPRHYPEPYYPPPGAVAPHYPPPGHAPPYFPPPGAPSPYDTPPGAGANGHGPGTSEPPGPATGPTDSVGRPLSVWTKRGAAFVLDAVIAGLAASVAVVAVLSNRITETTGGSASIHLRPGDSFLVSGLYFLSYTAYFTFLTGSRRGQTVGSMAVGIAVRDAAGGGQIGAARGLVRSMILSVFCVPILLIPWLLDMAVPLWTPTRQALHDRAVRSVVVDVR